MGKSPLGLLGQNNSSGPFWFWKFPSAFESPGDVELNKSGNWYEMAFLKYLKERGALYLWSASPRVGGNRTSWGLRRVTGKSMSDLC